MNKLILLQPDDWHLHVRNGEMLQTVIAHTAKQFARAIIMPNLKPAVTTVAQAQAYQTEIMRAVPQGLDFTPLMTLYLTNTLSAEEIKKVAEMDFINALKLYPAGATTNSEAGVSDLAAIYPVLEQMQRYDIPLLIHGEVTDPECDIFDRERVFVETRLAELVKQFPELRIVLEHVTTAEAVDFVVSASSKVAATITPQHLLFNRNALLAGGVRPHHYCLPIIKREKHRQALVKAATSANPKFFLGTDSAPHLASAKESSCGCAGCYSAHAALELYAEAFEQAGALDKLEGFASFYGADFYQLPRNTGTVTLSKQSWIVPEAYAVGDQLLKPLRANEEMHWKMLD